MSDLQAAIEGRLATIVQCTNVKPCAMCERQAEIIRTDLAALLKQARETFKAGFTAGANAFDKFGEQFETCDEAYAEFLKTQPPTGDAAP